MPATYTFDIFSSLDDYGSYGPKGDWGGYWGKQGPELLDHRLALYADDQRMVFGANTFRQFVGMIAASSEESEVRDPWVTQMRNLPGQVRFPSNRDRTHPNSRRTNCHKHDRHLVN